MSSTRNGILLDQNMLNYDFGENHVMSTQRIFAAYHLLSDMFLPHQNFNDIQTSTHDRKYLLEAHDEVYTKKLEQLSETGSGSALEYGLGTSDCPVWKGMADVSEFVVNSSVTMAENIHQGNIDLGFVLLGGLHHASRSKASGFCYYNDINVVIQRLKDLQPNIKILYIDTDLHHGDGVQDAYYSDPNVLTISYHESGQFLFPGTGFPDEIGVKKGRGASVNLPFFPYTWDEIYQDGFKRFIPGLFESFQPDYVIWQAGADAHIQDPLGHMMLTSETYNFLGRTLRDLSIDHMEKPRVLTLGGGGYNPYGNSKSWSNAIAGLTDFDLPKVGLDTWVKKCHSQGIDVKKSLHDVSSSPIEGEKDRILEANRSYQDKLLENLSEFYGL